MTSTESGHPLHDPRRLASVAATGLDAAPDEAFDRFAGLARTILGVPVALVSLVDNERQFFPGASGLRGSLADSRQAPLAFPFGPMVVATAEPLVITDARTDRRVGDGIAASDLQVVGYAGVPLTDDRGRVLGALCAIDDQPRHWSNDHLDALRDLAAACSSEIRLRLAAARAALTDARARQAESERSRLGAQVEAALHRTRRLLNASEAMTTADSIADVAAAAGGLVSSGAEPVHVGVAVVDPDGHRLNLFSAHTGPSGLTDRWINAQLDDDLPLCRSVRQRRAMFYQNRAELLADYPALQEDVDRLGWQALACAPLPGSQAVLGALLFAWAQPHPADEAERTMITTFAGYVTQAVQRILDLRDRVSVAQTLQRAMLTQLPEPANLQLAARYYPASAGEQVGGDWYDAFALPNGDTALVIGDVVGHDMSAAAVMGQLRSMLRAYAVDRQEPPSALLGRLDHANHLLGIDTSASVIVARVAETVDDRENGRLRLHWSNAGHPPPVLIHPDGRVDPLPGRDPLLGIRRQTIRTDYSYPLPAGGTVLLHTDGLVEARGHTIDDRTDKLHSLLRDLAGVPLDHLLDTVIDQMAGTDPEDDVALLACRLHPDGQVGPTIGRSAHT